MKKKQVSYIVEGPYKAKDWMQETRLAYLRIFTNQKGLEEIKQNPLQDYTTFGTMEDVAVDFNVYKVLVEDTDIKRVSSVLKTPVSRIKKGKFTKKELETVLNTECYEVDYRV